MPAIKGEISVGNMVSWVGLLITIIGVGIAIGQDRADITTLKAAQVQTSEDSRALIRLQADMDYLKRAIDELRGRP